MTTDASMTKKSKKLAQQEKEKKRNLKRKAHKKEELAKIAQRAEKRKAALSKPKTVSAKNQKVIDKIREAIRQGKRPSSGKVWHNVKFRRPKTQRLGKNPKYPRRSIPRDHAKDKYDILKAPMNTEKVIRYVEDYNTLVFYVDPRANKKQIKKAFKEMHNADVSKVRTLITPRGEKKAFIRVKGTEAVDIASKIGVV